MDLASSSAVAAGMEQDCKGTGEFLCNGGEPAEESSGLQVTISTLAGSTAAELQVKPSDTVLSLKQLLWVRTGTEVAKQRLILGETELEDVQTMEQCKVADGAKLCLVCVPTAEDQQNRMEVIVRCRPPRARDVEIGSRRVVEVDGSRGDVSVADVGDGPPRTFTFQTVLDDTAKQSEVYKTVGRDALQTVLEGYSTTIFAYGQTGSGKSHTLFGGGLAEPAQEEEGLAPRLFRQLFQITETLPTMCSGESAAPCCRSTWRKWWTCCPPILARRRRCGKLTAGAASTWRRAPTSRSDRWRS
ncbi:KIF3A [Symbiodinium sp. CCMP2592]|nr:KIF3A [Symbiodinium sp. CCMP2592]